MPTTASALSRPSTVASGAEDAPGFLGARLRASRSRGSRSSRGDRRRPAGASARSPPPRSRRRSRCPWRRRVAGSLLGRGRDGEPRAGAPRRARVHRPRGAGVATGRRPARRRGRVRAGRPGGRRPRGRRSRSFSDGGLVLAEDAPQRVGDLAERRAGAQGLPHRRQQVARSPTPPPPRRRARRRPPAWSRAARSSRTRAHLRRDLLLADPLQVGPRLLRDRRSGSRPPRPARRDSIACWIRNAASWISSW